MNSGRRVYATVTTAAALFLCCVCVLAARAWAGDDDDARVMLFSGRDLWRNGAFGYGGLVLAPGGFEQDGLLLKALLSDGPYSFSGGNVRKERTDSLAQVLPGWRVKRGDTELKFFFGPELQKHSLRPDNSLNGFSLGLRLAMELWYEPSPNTMVAADVALSSIATSNSARIGYGWRVFEEMLGGIYVGPEIQYFGLDGYRHLRLGAHLTSMKTDDVEWSAAMGWASDSQRRAGPFLRLNILKRL